MRFAISIICLIIFSACHETKQKLPSNLDDQFNHLNPNRSDLSFAESRIDFGKVPKDTMLSGLFRFKNTGTDTLFIETVLPDCSCTSFKLSKNRIMPNDTGSIVLNMSTKHKFGKVQVYSTIEANTKTRLYSLEILADVK